MKETFIWIFFKTGSSIFAGEDMNSKFRIKIIPAIE